MSRRRGVVTCAVLEDEVRRLARALPEVGPVEVLPPVLHREPALLREGIREAVGRLEARPEVREIVLVYGLCGRGTVGVSSRRVRLVLPRVHDCIALLLGDRDRYEREVRAHPGTYWTSAGWIRCDLLPAADREEARRLEYERRYGPDNADYLLALERSWTGAYERVVYVDSALERDRSEEAKEWARSCGLRFERVAGDPRLLEDLLAGRWDEERFVVLEPGQVLLASGDRRIVEVGPADAP